MSEENKRSVEDMLKILEDIVTQLEGDDVSLDDAFSLYERGMKLVKECDGEIDTIEKKVLALNEGGETYEFQ